MVEYKYDAWGNHEAEVASEDYVTLANLNPFRYRGYYYDSETGLYFLQTRYYDPEVGRFISRDSIEYADPETICGLNLYAYCGNNPVMATDPTGRAAWWEWLVAGIVTAVLVVGAVALNVITAGTASVFIGVGVAAITGAAAASALSFSASIVSGNLDLGQFFIDVGVGAITGVVTAGLGQIASAAGKVFGTALDFMKIGGLQVGSVYGFGNLAAIFGKTFEIVSGIVSGIALDKNINKLLKRQDNLMERVKNNLLSGFLSAGIDFIRYLW